MNRLMYYSKPDVSGKTNKTLDICVSLTQLMQLSQKANHKNLKEERHYKKRISQFKIPLRLTKLYQVLSSDRLYSNHALHRHSKSLCLELDFAFSLTSVTKSLHLTIVILQKK